MKRWVATGAAVVLASAALHADLTMTQSITLQGGPAAMMGGNAAPTIVMRIKGMKTRTETEVMGQTHVILADLTARQVIMLNAADKTARILPMTVPAGSADQASPELDVSFKPTGQKRTIDNRSCDEYAIAMTVNMASLGGRSAEMPPEAAQMLQGVQMMMKGSSWIAKSGPGIAEFAAFQKAAADANMLGAISGALGGSSNGLDRVMAASASTHGLPYLTEMTMSVEGTGQIVDMMKQMGAMTLTNKVTGISTEPLSDDLFTVPAGYTMVK